MRALKRVEERSLFLRFDAENLLCNTIWSIWSDTRYDATTDRQISPALDNEAMETIRFAMGDLWKPGSR